MILEKNVKLKLLNVEFSKNGFKTCFGKMGEMIAEEVLLKEGFKVYKWRPCVAGSAHACSKLVKNGIYSNFA